MKEGQGGMWFVFLREVDEDKRAEQGQKGYLKFVAIVVTFQTIFLGEFKIKVILQTPYFKQKCTMDLVYVDIELFNFADESLCEDSYLPKEKIRKITINAMADSGAIRLAINENIRQQLGLRVSQQLDISLANGTKRRLDVAGPVRLKFRDRDCITDAFVLPEK